MPIAYRHPTRTQLPVAIAPVSAAVSRLRGKRITPTHLDSGEIATLPLAAREAGFFSAKVAKAETLSLLQRQLDQALSLPAEQAFKNKAAFVADVRRAMGAAPGDSGKLTDITSVRRLGLIYDFQLEDAYSHARWERDSNSPDLLDEFPCQEFLRVESRKTVRPDWPARWLAAGGEFTTDGRMIARKDSAVWTKLSRFGRPWPPFDYGSGMGVQDISREEAESLKIMSALPDEQKVPVLPKGQQVRKPTKDYLDSLVKSTRSLSPEMLEALQEEFAGSIKVQGGKVEFFVRPEKLLVDWKAERRREQLAPLPQIPREEVDAWIAAHPTVDVPGVGTATWDFRHQKSSRGHDRAYRRQLLPAALETLQRAISIPNPDRPDEPGQKVYWKLFGAERQQLGMVVMMDGDRRIWNYHEIEPEELESYRKAARQIHQYQKERSRDAAPTQL